MSKKCFLCNSDGGVLDFNDETFRNCSSKLAFRKIKNFKYNVVELTSASLEFVGYHTTCYKKVTVLNKKYNEEFNYFCAGNTKYGHKAVKKNNEHTDGHTIKQELQETEEIQIQLRNSDTENPEDVFIEETTYYSDNEEIEEEDPVQKRSRNSSTTTKRHRDEETPGSDMTQLTRMMKDISSHLHVLTNQRQDRFDSFGKYVSAMLRNMPENKALEVQPQIVDLLVAASVKTEERDILS